ncbi:hypothetical protein BD413DRAFT_128561 [Trametes elegans]|nr:hypothetical protein BD413DRAFT_128561 [Trametes elegans]
MKAGDRAQGDGYPMGDVSPRARDGRVRASRIQTQEAKALARADTRRHAVSCPGGWLLPPGHISALYMGLKCRVKQAGRELRPEGSATQWDEHARAAGQVCHAPAQLRSRSHIDHARSQARPWDEACARQRASIAYMSGGEQVCDTHPASSRYDMGSHHTGHSLQPKPAFGRMQTGLGDARTVAPFCRLRRRTRAASGQRPRRARTRTRTRARSASAGSGGWPCGGREAGVRTFLSFDGPFVQIAGAARSALDVRSSHSSRGRLRRGRAGGPWGSGRREKRPGGGCSGAGLRGAGLVLGLGGKI